MGGHDGGCTMGAVVICRRSDKTARRAEKAGVGAFSSKTEAYGINLTKNPAADLAGRV